MACGNVGFEDAADLEHLAAMWRLAGIAEAWVDDLVKLQIPAGVATAASSGCEKDLENDP